MIVIGHRIKGINAQRYDPAEKAQLKNINTNAHPIEMKEGNSADKNKKVLILEWKLTSTYDLTNGKKLAELEITGDLLFQMEAKEYKTAMDNWKKDKKIKKEQLLPMVQGIFNVAQVQAILIARELNLPSPLNLVRIQEK